MFLSDEFFNDDTKFKRLMITMIFLMALSLVLSSFIKICRVEGRSMEPNLHPGNRYLMVRSSLVRDYKRGDIVILKLPGGKQTIVKRVVGLPGEELEIKDGHTFIDGQMLEESYPIIRDRTFDYSIMLNQDEVFLLGDNQKTSYDSRFFGPVKIKEIKGKIAYKIFGK